MSGFTHFVKASGLQPVGCHSKAKAERLIARHQGTAVIWTRAEYVAWQRQVAASPTRVEGFTIGI